MASKKDKVFAPLEDFIAKSPDMACPPDLKKQLAEKVRETKENLGTPLETDKWIYRFVVVFLGFAILGSLTFTFFIFFRSLGSQDLSNLKIPDIFLAIGSAAVGALAGLLAPSPQHGSNE